MSLTARQHQCLRFVAERIATDGVCPSFHEIREELQLASNSGIYRLVTALQDRGYLRRLRGRARSLEVTTKGISILPPSFAGPVSDEALRALSEVDLWDLKVRVLEEVNRRLDAPRPAKARPLQAVAM